MIEIEIRHLTAGQDSPPEWTALTTLWVDGDHAKIEGDESLIDFTIPVVNLRTGEQLRFEEDREEWARALSHTFRSPDLCAAVVHDDNPISRDELATPDVRRRSVELRAREVAS